MDGQALEAIHVDGPSAGERAALVERYTDGECLTMAFAVHWMTGWPVEALSEREGEDSYLHFAAIGPDGLAWDAAGPRDKTEVARHFADEPSWEAVDVARLVLTQPGVDEATITEACLDAIRLLGEKLVPHLARVPEVPAAAPCP